MQNEKFLSRGWQKIFRFFLCFCISIVDFMPAFAADASGGTGPNSIFDIVREDGGVRDAGGGEFSEAVSGFQEEAVQIANQAIMFSIVANVVRIAIIIAVIAAVFFLIFRLTKKK